MLISLNPEQEKFVQKKLENSQYKTIDELIAKAFYLLEQQEKLEQKSQIMLNHDQLSWQDTYQEMAQENEDWSDGETMTPHS